MKTATKKPEPVEVPGDIPLILASPADTGQDDIYEVCMTEKGYTLFNALRSRGLRNKHSGCVSLDFANGLRADRDRLRESNKEMRKALEQIVKLVHGADTENEAVKDARFVARAAIKRAKESTGGDGR